MPNLDALALCLGYTTLGESLPSAIERVEAIFPDAIDPQLSDCPPIVKLVSLRLRGVVDHVEASLSIRDHLAKGYSLLDSIALLPRHLRAGEPYLRG